jgi:imidazoleglycerol-phosphate dehydratase/histidinol-phosphatase
MVWGTDSFPEDTFWPTQNFILRALRMKESFDDIFVDRSFPEDNAPHKPRTGMLTKYIDNLAYDLVNSFVLGDRLTDVELAKTSGLKLFCEYD